MNRKVVLGVAAGAGVLGLGWWALRTPSGQQAVGRAKQSAASFADQLAQFQQKAGHALTNMWSGVVSVTPLMGAAGAAGAGLGGPIGAAIGAAVSSGIGTGVGTVVGTLGGAAIGAGSVGAMGAVSGLLRG